MQVISGGCIYTAAKFTGIGQYQAPLLETGNPLASLQDFATGRPVTSTPLDTGRPVSNTLLDTGNQLAVIHHYADIARTAGSC